MYDRVADANAKAAKNVHAKNKMGSTLFMDEAFDASYVNTGIAANRTRMPVLAKCVAISSVPSSTQTRFDSSIS